MGIVTCTTGCAPSFSHTPIGPQSPRTTWQKIWVSFTKGKTNHVAATFSVNWGTHPNHVAGGTHFLHLSTYFVVHNNYS
jgi:hypothetical protein